jgi:putative membrane protein
MNEPSVDTTPRAGVGNELAVQNMLLAYERTMLSWVRTATSLISFGFSIQQFFRATRIADAARERLLGPAELGTAMTVIGLVALLLATVDQRVAMRELGLRYPVSAGYPPIPRSHSRILAALIALLGLCALLVRFVRFN